MANQYTSKHDLNTLPKWARLHITSIEAELYHLQNKFNTVQSINAIMCEPKRDWFTLPFSYDGDKPIHLWLLNFDQPLSVCSLGKGDLLFVGRANKDGAK